MKTSRFLRAGGMLSLGLLLGATVAGAADATWSASPTNGDWNSPANWTPTTVPNGSSDIATFGDSNIADLFVTQDTEVAAIEFGIGSPAYTITIGLEDTLTISGNGISNTSGSTQTFITNSANPKPSGMIAFTGSATAGSMTTFTNRAAPARGGIAGVTYFFDTSTAGKATFVNQGSAALKTDSGLMYLGNEANAGDAIVTNQPGTASGAYGGRFIVNDQARAGNAVVVAEGATVDGSESGVTTFIGNSHAGSATLIATGGSNGGLGGRIYFNEFSFGDRVRIKVFGNGVFDVGAHGYFDGKPVMIGSLEGDGSVVLAQTPLFIGSNNQSTTYSGIMTVINNFASVTKIGKGTLVLTGANTYGGGTFIEGGALRVSNTTGSGVGSGAVAVSAGTLGGRGIIAGAVTIGTGAGPDAFLAPGTGQSNPATLTIQSALTFKADGSYTYKLNARKVRAAQVIANGATIESGAQFNFSAVANKRLAMGTTFTALSNTSATPINGTFGNLPDGSSFTAGRNTFQASYTGGDGNDLTLTVVP